MTCTLLAAIYLPYAVSVGGDFMGLHRFIMPMFVVAAIAVTSASSGSSARVPGARARCVAIAACTVLVGAFAVHPARADAPPSLRRGNLAADHGVIDTPAFLMVYTEDRATIGRAMAAVLPRR